MLYEDEKDYIMRMIKEMVRVLFSLMLGKQYTQVELPRVNRFLVSGKNLGDLKEMADQGKINEAENLLLESLDYENKEEVTAAVLFYEYVGQMEESFLKENGYSLEEVYDGLMQIARNSGYGELVPGSLPETE
ncbi:MAG: hypothetical protein K1W40_17445 [Schaedlerella sp.]|uniref:DUF6483 family protein n=1 Tax=Schaedlerella sp. TaxID=2676057 RepID=UPI0035289BFF